MRPAPTEEQLRKLRSIEATRKQIIVLVTTAMPLVAVIGLNLKQEALIMAVAVGALVVVMSGAIYISFCLRCPRCSGWIAIPKCPACGLKLESGKSGEQT